MADNYEKYLARRITELQKNCDKFRDLYFETDEKRMKFRYDLCLANIELKQAIVEKEQMKNEKENLMKILEVKLHPKEEISNLASSNPMKMTPNYEDKIKSIEEEVAVLKATMEKQEFAFSHNLELLKVQHSTDMQKLYSKIEELETKSTLDDRTATEAARSEIMELNSKIKGLVSENEALESKMKKILREKELLEKEFSSLQEENKSLKKEILDFSSQLENCKDKYQSLSANFKQELGLLKQQHQSEKEMLIDEISRTKAELNDAHQHLWKSNELQKEKEKLEELYISTATHAIGMLSRSKTVAEDQEITRVKNVKEVINELKQQNRASEEDHDFLKLKYSEDQHELKQTIENLEAGLQIERNKASEKENVEYNNKLNDKILWLNENIAELDSLKESVLQNGRLESIKAKVVEIKNRFEEYRLPATPESTFRDEI